MKTNFILQSPDDGYSCMFITFINAYINKHGKSPIPYKYDTDEYYQFVDSIFIEATRRCCLNDGFYPLISEKFGVEYALINPTSNYELKEKMIAAIADGNAIDFSGHAGDGSLHSYLVIDYDFVRGSFCCVNALYNTIKSPIEWLQYHQMVDCKLYKHKLHGHGDRFFSMAKRETSFRLAKESRIIMFKAQ